MCKTWEAQKEHEYKQKTKSLTGTCIALPEPKEGGIFLIVMWKVESDNFLCLT